MFDQNKIIFFIIMIMLKYEINKYSFKKKYMDIYTDIYMDIYMDI